MRRLTPLFFALCLLILIGVFVTFAPAGIIQAIIPAAVPTPNRQGSTGTKFFICTGSFTSGNLVATDSNGNCVDSGGGGGGSGTPLFTSTATATVSSGTIGTIVGTGVGSTTIPSAYFNTAGATLGIQAQGVLASGTAPGALELLITLGGITVASGAVTPGASSDTQWTLSCFVVARSPGSSGTLMSNCLWTVGGSTTVQAIGLPLGDGGNSFDTTGTLAFDLQAHWLSFTSGDSIQGTTIVLYSPGGGSSGGGGGPAVSLSTFAGLGACTSKAFLTLFTNALIDSAYCNGSSVLTYLWDGRAVSPPETTYTFAWINQGDATLTVTSGAGVLFGGTASGIDSRIRATVAPSTPYHVIVGYKWRGDTGNSTNSMAGPCFEESSSGKVMIATGSFQGTSFDPVIFGLNSPTSFGGTEYNPGSGSWNGNSTGTYWIRLGDNGTNITFDYSENGYNWQNYFSQARGGFFTTAPDHVCYYVNGGNSIGEITVITFEEGS